MKRIVLPNQEFFQCVEQMLQQGKEVEIAVKGQSMRPFLKHGEKVIVAPLLHHTLLKRGMIILARTADGTVMMHRIFRISGEQIVMKGDGNLYQTEPIQRNDILGIATSVVRNGKQTSLYTIPRQWAAWCWRNMLVRRIGLKIYDRFIC